MVLYYFETDLCSLVLRLQQPNVLILGSFDPIEQPHLVPLSDCPVSVRLEVGWGFRMEVLGFMFSFYLGN